MAHLAGAVEDVLLPQTGVDVAIPTEQLYHVNGTPREQWIPPVQVEDAAADGSDAILTRGLAEL
jgi:carboxyl-terminal processing protease